VTRRSCDLSPCFDCADLHAHVAREGAFSVPVPKRRCSVRENAYTGINCTFNLNASRGL
jgi:hypothetical protein